MLKQRNKSVCRLLKLRESGCMTHTDVVALTRMGVILADRALVHRHTIHEVLQITPNERSAYVIESSIKGYAVTSHTSRCVSIIKTGTMVKIDQICDIQRNNRTVWTIAIHPNDPSLVATGNMGGIASVYKDLQLYATDDNDNQRISSICFHPTLDLVCYGIQNQVIVWNWQENTRLALCTKDGLKIKYVKYIPSTGMLITGIRRETSETFDYILDSYANDERLLNGSATYFLMSLFRTFAVVFDHMDFRDCDINLNQYWSGCLQQLRLFARRLVMVNGHVEPFKMIPLLGVHVNHIQDFAITLKVFSNKATAIASRVPNYNIYDNIGDEFVCENEIRALRAIVARCRKETVLIKNGYDIDIGLLEDTFSKIHKIMVLHHQDSQHFENNRIYADFSRYHMKLQAWHFELTDLPDLKQDWRNVITCCLIHNDSSVDISRCGKIVATFRELSNGRFQINVHSLELHTFGQRLFTHDNYKLTIMMTVSISPSRQYLLVGLRSDRIFAYFLRIGNEYGNCDAEDDDSGGLGALTHLVRFDKQSDDSISVLKWMARPGDGAIIGYRSFQLHCIRYK